MQICSVWDIKEKEKEAAQIISEVKDEVMKKILSAEEKNADFIREKDEVLEEDEKKIKEKYYKEMKDILKKLDHEEQREIEKINSLCEKNREKVVRFITAEIVKE